TGAGLSSSDRDGCNEFARSLQVGKSVFWPEFAYFFRGVLVFPGKFEDSEVRMLSIVPVSGRKSAEKQGLVALAPDEFESASPAAPGFANSISTTKSEWSDTPDSRSTCENSADFKHL